MSRNLGHHGTVAPGTKWEQVAKNLSIETEMTDVEHTLEELGKMGPREAKRSSTSKRTRK